MIISAILAIGNDNEIGLNGSLPWKSRDDLKHFKALTSNHCILMGYNTYKSLNKPLPNRTNIVISRTINKLNGCYVFSSIEDGIEFAEQTKETELFIIGGASVYKYCAEKHLIDRVYLTKMMY